jgi:hypothetical protein
VAELVADAAAVVSGEVEATPAAAGTDAVVRHGAVTAGEEAAAAGSTSRGGCDRRGHERPVSAPAPAVAARRKWRRESVG